MTRRARPASPVARYAVVHDVDGPKVRLGAVWFALVIGSAYLDRMALATVMAVAAALAADEVVRLHVPMPEAAGRNAVERLLADPSRLPVLLAGAALPLAASAGSDTLGAAVVAVLMTLPVWRLATRRSPDVALAPIAALAVPALGLAASAPVLLHRLGPWAAVVLLVLVSAYDAGDFLVGTGAASTWEGPAAGVVAVLVCAFACTVAALPPLGVHGAIALGALTALLAPFGPPLASLLIGDGRTKARFVRRLDVLLLLAPVAAWATPAATG